jgi:hypothetical protein
MATYKANYPALTLMSQAEEAKNASKRSITSNTKQFFKEKCFTILKHQKKQNALGTRNIQNKKKNN